MREDREDHRNRPRRPFQHVRFAAPRFFQLMGDMPGPFALKLGHRFARRMINKHLRIVRQLHARRARPAPRSEEHTSELQSLMRISYAVFCLKKKNTKDVTQTTTHTPTHNLYKTI